MDKQTDRELLEAAAKAAGMDDARWNVEQGSIETLKQPGFRLYWNPLTRDGDALRLAVKLDMHVMHGRKTRSSCVICDNASELEEWGDDPYAATRRAIVRAAAALAADDLSRATAQRAASRELRS